MNNFEMKRGAKRIRVKVPLHLDSGSGVTRDVSPSGIYFFTDRPFIPEVTFRFVLVLDHVFPGEPVCLHCRGKVVRVEEVDGKTGVAASISEFGSAA